MSTEKPQPRFRIWDTVSLKNERQKAHYTVLGIQWEYAIAGYTVQVIDTSIGVKQRWFENDFDLIKRGQSHPVTAPQSHQGSDETPEEKVARLWRECAECDDKSWLDRQMAWEQAKKELENSKTRPDTSQTVNNNDLNQRLQDIEERLKRVELQTTLCGPVGPSPKIFFDQWVRPVRVGTEPAPTDQDG